MGALDYIAEPVDRALLKKELNGKRFVRKTNKGGNEIYIVDYHNSPNVVKEIGRLRELTFAASGGGTGKSIDLDEHDTAEKCYQQLIIYSPEDEEIIGGYRFVDCSIFDEFENTHLSTQHYFTFSQQFVEEYLPATIELGRSWVQPMYQPNINPRKGLFSLDNLWDGLGAISVDYDHILYFFGKVTMYPSYNKEARNAVLTFMHHFFPDKDNLVKAIHPIDDYWDEDFVQTVQGLSFNEGLKVLNQFVKERGEHIPPLINQYMQLSPTMKTFDTAINNDFGEVEETGILVTIADIYDAKKIRHIETYVKQ